MQLAARIFKIQTAANGLLRFADGETAYITRRFDRRKGEKLGQEDFCQLSARTPDNAGRNYKYDASYEEVGEIVRKYCKAGKIEIEKLYALILFCYLCGNGDAHLKNFSLLESSYGDYLLSPAYDLINTALHFSHEQRMALDLFRDYETESFQDNGFYKRADFLKLAEFYEIPPGRVQSFPDLAGIKKNDYLDLI